MCRRSYHEPIEDIQRSLVKLYFSINVFQNIYEVLSILFHNPRCCILALAMMNLFRKRFHQTKIQLRLLMKFRNILDVWKRVSQSQYPKICISKKLPKPYDKTSILQALTLLRMTYMLQNFH